MPSAPQNRVSAYGRSFETQRTVVPSSPAGPFVEGAHARRAGAGVERVEDVEHEVAAGEVGERHGGHVRTGELEVRRLGADRGQLADGVERGSLVSDLGHAPILADAVIFRAIRPMIGRVQLAFTRRW